MAEGFIYGLLVFLIIVLVWIAYVFGKRAGENVKVGDKLRLIGEEGKNRLLQQEKKYEVELEKAKHERDVSLEKLAGGWQLKYLQDMEELKKDFIEAEKQIRLKSLSSSRRSLIGKYIERFIPFLAGVKYAPADMHFLGQPIDYVVFEGLERDAVEAITFLEVKTGESKLTPREKSIKKVVESKKVFWEELRVDTFDEEAAEKEEELPDESLLAENVFRKIDEKVEEVSKGFRVNSATDNSDDTDESESSHDAKELQLVCVDCLVQYSESESVKGKCPKCGSKNSVVKI